MAAQWDPVAIAKGEHERQDPYPVETSTLLVEIRIMPRNHVSKTITGDTNSTAGQGGSFKNYGNDHEFVT